MFIVVVSICLAAVNGATIQKRSVAVTPPCFLSYSGDPVQEQSLSYFLQIVNARITGFVAHAYTLKKTMDKEYYIEVPETDKETASFMNLSHINALDEPLVFVNEFCSNSTSFSEKMRTHFDLLNQLSNYIDQLLKTAKDGTSLERLELFQHEIYDCMCSLKVALRSQNQDPIVKVPDGELSDDFIEYRNGMLTTSKQQTSEYVIVLDSQRIANFMVYLYNLFNEVSFPTCG